MQKLSITAAWGQSVAFVKTYLSPLAIVLIGVGVLAPLLVQLVLSGGNGFGMNAATLAQRSMMSMGGAGLGGIIGFILQLGSYYAAWRIGFSGGQDDVGSTLRYGLVAALPAMLVMIGGIIVLFLILMLVGLMFGGAIGFGALMAGDFGAGGGIAAVIGIFALVIALLVVMLWLTARLCCMGPAMAARQSYNPLDAIAESWRITRAGQWRIVGYFVVIGLVLMVVSGIVGAMAVGAMMSGAGGAASIVAIFAVSLITGIPLAFLYAAVPYGLYRELGEEDRSDIFA